MKKIAFAFIAALAVLSFAGCKKKEDTAMKDAMAKMEGFKTAMCACKDKDCAEKVMKDMMAWGESMKGKVDEKKMSEADKQKSDAMRAEMEKCMTTAMGPAPTPPGEGAAPTPPAGGEGAAPATPPAGGEGAAPATPPAGGEGAAPAAGGETKPEEKKPEEKK